MIAEQITTETLSKNPPLQKHKAQELLGNDSLEDNLVIKHGLYLATLQALKGKDGLKRGLSHLAEISQASPSIINNPLYQALYWEFSAYEGRSSAEVIQGALKVAKTQSGLSRYHAARALFATGSLNIVLAVLDSVVVENLSQRQKSRHYLLLGETYQSLGQFVEATKAFEQAVKLGQALESQQVFLNLASCWLKADQILYSLNALTNIEVRALNKSERAHFYLIKGQIALKQGDFETAFNELGAAQNLADYFENTLEIYLSLAQSCMLIGKTKQAFTYFRKAIKESKAMKSFVKHEYAFALMSEKNYLEAKSLLEDVVKDNTYNMSFQALTDLGEINYHLGHLTEAEYCAKEALKQGEGLKSCLLLGQIACARYQYDEAITHFEKALSETQKGDKNWLLAHTMIADTLVKQGFKEPSRITLHARAALSHMPMHETWQVILQGYMGRAMEMIGGNIRVLN